MGSVTFDDTLITLREHTVIWQYYIAECSEFLFASMCRRWTFLLNESSAVLDHIARTA